MAREAASAPELAERVLEGDPLALARLMTWIENQDPAGLETLGRLYAHTGRAHRIGVTGASGTGKSSLVNRLALTLRKAGAGAPRVAVVAVDPTSPFTGGAILGDRIRMRDLAGDPGVFIRSMASRGALGGLARATAEVVEVLDAAGYGVIFIETVGAGQTEVEIASTAQTTLVVDAPGLGDDVQAIKAGILEIADILVVNKADLPGADHTLRMLRSTLEMAPTEPTPRWTIPVLATVATTGQGILELLAAVDAHRAHLDTTGEGARKRRERVRLEMETLLREHLARRWMQRQTDGRFDDALERVLARQLAPRQAVEELLESHGT